MKNDNYHESVMTGEVIKHLGVSESPNGKYIDATLGTGGHSQAILNAGGNVLGIEMDLKMLSIAKNRLGEKAKLVQGNFINIDEIAKKSSFDKVDGILLDLGVSNLHLKNDERGFSFTNEDQILDMRLNSEIQGVMAKDLLNALDKTQLTKLFLVTMIYPDAKKLAEEIIKYRPLEKVQDLLLLTKDLRLKTKLHPGTLPMLALRIAVNSELENLEIVLPKAIELLKSKGKLLVITFHSKEAEIVKKFMSLMGCEKRMVLPRSTEIDSNQKARSAKLWIIQKN